VRKLNARILVWIAAAFPVGVAVLLARAAGADGPPAVTAAGELLVGPDSYTSNVAADNKVTSIDAALE
jgi:hypothetical protein